MQSAGTKGTPFFIYIDSMINMIGDLSISVELNISIHQKEDNREI